MVIPPLLVLFLMRRPPRVGPPVRPAPPPAPAAAPAPAAPGRVANAAE